MCYFNDVNNFMMRLKIAPSYDKQWLEVERPQPLTDNKIEGLIADVVTKQITKDTSDAIYDEFKELCHNWIFQSKLNHLIIGDDFRQDIIIGCTQFIDSLYMKGPVQTLRGDYKYHERLGYSYIKDVGSLIPGIPLIIALPFPQQGAIHIDMEEILHEAMVKQIDVHIDCAWVSCSRNLHFDFRHPSINSIGYSLSKGMGLGWNRIGVRYTKDSKPDAVTLMNDFHMNNRALVLIGLYFLKNLPSDYLWTAHGERYNRICKDFNLTPTNSIHLALDNGQPVGVSPLIRYLENEST